MRKNFYFTTLVLQFPLFPKFTCTQVSVCVHILLLSAAKYELLHAHTHLLSPEALYINEAFLRPVPLFPYWLSLFSACFNAVAFFKWSSAGTLNSFH